MVVPFGYGTILSTRRQCDEAATNDTEKKPLTPTSHQFVSLSFGGITDSALQLFPAR